MIILHIATFLIYSAILIAVSFLVGVYVGEKPKDQGHT